MLKKLFRSRRSKATLFSYIDCLFPKQSHKVLFVVKNRTHFSGNLRVVLETYLDKHPETLYIYKDGTLSSKLKEELETLGVVVLDGFTLYSIWHILTSGTVILSHNPRDAHITRKFKTRKIINLWHGVAIKQIELLMPNIKKEKLLLLKNNSRLYDMVISSSEQDRETNINAFGVPRSKVKVTGLPRYEILKNDYVLGSVLSEENHKIKKIKGDKKLILFAPTFREYGTSPILQITDEEWRALDCMAKKENILFGIRPHPYDIKYLPKSIQDSPLFCLFENTVYTEVNLLLKYTDVLIVDFSSIWIDYLLLHKPIIGFAKDYEAYLYTERGFIYDFKNIFPAPIISNIEHLIKEITHTLKNNREVNYAESIRLFHVHNPEYHYAKRIYNEIKMLKV